MLCLACAEALGSPLCDRCRDGLGVVPPQVLRSGLVLIAAYRHTGPARRLVHRLKYQGLVPAARVLAGAMAPLLPNSTAAVVPVPRARLRRIQYGVDPALELARAISRITGVPVIPALRPALWWPRHAGHNRRAAAARFRQVAAVPTGAVILDDVVTSGRTMEAAIRSIDTVVWQGVSATSPGRVAGEGPRDAPKALETAWRHDRTG